MRERTGQPKLRLIASGGEEIVLPRGDDVAATPAAAPRAPDEPLMHELPARRGRRPSSVSPPGAGRRPPRADKAAGPPPLHLLTSDGIQPAQAPPDDDGRDEQYYEHERDIRRIATDLNRLRFAIVDLAAIELPPARLLQELSPGLDRPVIAERLAQAMAWLARFSEEWEREERVTPPR